MARVLSVVGLVAAAVAVAIAPTAAVPVVTLRPATLPTATGADASLVSGLCSVAAAHQLEDLHPDTLIMRGLELVWEAFTAGERDPIISAFKAGQLEAQIGTPADALEGKEEAFRFIRETIPRLYSLIDAVKKGE